MINILVVHKYSISSPPSILSFLIVFSLILIVFMPFSYAKTDVLVEYGGGISSLDYPNSQHIVMNDDGDELGIAFIGVLGDSTQVTFRYRDLPSVLWGSASIRETTNETAGVSIARDENFNIHAIYFEWQGTNRQLFYKFFQWSDKTWYSSPNAILERDSSEMGYQLTTGTGSGWGIGDIKVTSGGNIHVINNDWTAPYRELVHYRYNVSAGFWDLTNSIVSEISPEFNYAYPSLVLDSVGILYLTYAECQTERNGTNFYDVYFTKSSDGGEHWVTPTQLINKTYPNNVIPTKLIIDNSNILHFAYNGNFTGNQNYLIGYGKSNDYGDTWSFMNVTTSGHSRKPTLTKDANNILYFLYGQVDSYGSVQWNLTGRKYQNNIFGDEIRVTNNEYGQTSPSLVFSNTYNQFSSSGVIGVYEDRENAYFEIRYLEMNELELTTGGIFVIEVFPDKPQYRWLEEIDVQVTNLGTENGDFRIVNNTGVPVYPEVLVHHMMPLYLRFLIPSDFGVGTWSLQAKLQSQTWLSDYVENETITVVMSNTSYFITASDSFVHTDGFIGGSWSAFAGEQYYIIMQNAGFSGDEFRNSTTEIYADDRTVVVDNLFVCDVSGVYQLILKNTSDYGILAVSLPFTVSTTTPHNVFTLIFNDRYVYTDRPTLTIRCTGRDDYNYYVFNENGIVITSDIVLNGGDMPFQLLMTVLDIGTATFSVFDVGDSVDSGVSATFEIYDPSASTGDEVIDTFIGIPAWVKGIVGVILTLAFVFLPFILMNYLNIKTIDIPPVIYAICGGLGAVLCTLLQLWGWEVAFFICVISAISLIISYVWKGKGE